MFLELHLTHCTPNKRTNKIKEEESNMFQKPSYFYIGMNAILTICPNTGNYT